jgi:hypothetical protein
MTAAENNPGFEAFLVSSLAGSLKTNSAPTVFPAARFIDEPSGITPWLLIAHATSSTYARHNDPPEHSNPKFCDG